MLGRMLRVALTYWNEHCTFCGVTNVQFQYLKSEQTKFYSEFLAAAVASPGAAVCVAPFRARLAAVTEFEAGLAHRHDALLPEPFIDPHVYPRRSLEP